MDNSENIIYQQEKTWYGDNTIDVRYKDSPIGMLSKDENGKYEFELYSSTNYCINSPELLRAIADKLEELNG